jgi:ribosome-associated heat shock protein Hsp15
VNGQRIDAASRVVRLGDVVTVALDRSVRVLKVLGFADRRGPAAAAQGLCEDLQPPAPRSDKPAKPAAMRAAGAGRPTKRERRALDRFTGGDDLGEDDL